MDIVTSYNFTDRERAFFERLRSQFQTSVASGIQMICSQQDLPGQWAMKPDGSGLERTDVTVPAAAELLPLDQEDRPTKRKNALA